MAKQPTLTGVGAVLFIAGLVLLFTALFRNATHGGPILWAALVLLAATIGCWAAAAKTPAAEQ